MWAEPERSVSKEKDDIIAEETGLTAVFGSMFANVQKTPTGEDSLV